MPVHPEEKKLFQRSRDEASLPVDCAWCGTWPSLEGEYSAASAEYQRQMDPALRDGPPEGRVTTRFHDLSLARQRRAECERQRQHTALDLGATTLTED